MSKGTRIAATAALGVALLLTIACEDSGLTAPQDGSLTVLVSPSEVTLDPFDPAGGAANAEVRAIVLTSEGVPLEGVSVTLASSSDTTSWLGTTARSITVRTDAQGTARATLVISLGPTGNIDLTANSGGLTGTAKVRRDVDCGDGNRTPVAVVAGLDPSQPNLTGDDFPIEIELDGGDSTDPDNDPLTFEWDCGASGQSVGTEIPGAPPGTTCRYPGPGTYSVTLTVADDGNGVGVCARAGEDTFQVTLGCGGNHAPVANAGPDVSDSNVTFPHDVQLDGSASTDQDGDPLATHTWNCGLGGTVLSGGNTAHVTCRYTTAGTKTATLTVTDDDGVCSKTSLVDSVTVTLTAAP